jgi:hypothetical protein
MSDFEINLNDLEDSKSITSSIKRSFYPQNQQIVKSTSHSQSNNFDRTLMSRDINKVLQGDGIYRNPAFSLAAYEQNTKSSMHTILAMGSDLDQVSVPDPDYTGDGSGEEGVGLLTGSQARVEIARKSLMSTGIAPGGFESAMQAFVSSNIADPISGAGATNVVVNSNGDETTHGSTGYPDYIGAQVYNNANKSITFKDELTQEELLEYDRKVNTLLKKSKFDTNEPSIFKNGFGINFNTNSKNQDLTKLGFSIQQAGSYIQINPGEKPKYQTEIIDQKILGTGTRTVMVSPALLELLNRLTDSLYIKGDLDATRGLVGPNFTELTSSNNSITDHAFGRAIDIFAVGQSIRDKISFKNPVPSAQVYLDGLKLLLQYIEALPQELHPDLIVVSDQISNQLGIVSGLEDSSTAVKKMFPNLSVSVNFHSDSSHRNHIHLSFASKRSGVILPPVGKMPVTGETYSPSTQRLLTGIDKFKKVYKQTDDPLSELEVFTLLNSYGNFGEEVAAVFTGIAHRESRFNPWATNDSGFWSMWQLGTRTKQGGTNVFEIQVPSQEKIEFWKLSYKNWKEENLTVDTIDNFVRPLQKNDPSKNAGRGFFDERAFIPINQVWALRAKLGAKGLKFKFNKLTNGNLSLLDAWGERFLYYGWVSKVPYSIVRNAYTKGTGKSESVLRAWLLQNIPQNSRIRNPDPTTGKTILESWLDGKVYTPVIYQKSDGSYNAPEGWPALPTPR